MENATKTANNRKKMKKIFVTLEKVCNFATDYGFLNQPLHGEIIRICLTGSLVKAPIKYSNIKKTIR